VSARVKCLYCFYSESKVVDSRPTDEGARVRRRRECLSCEKRFTTYEIIETAPIMVVKKDKTRQAFDRGKLLAGFVRACEKRPISFEQLEEVVDAVQTSVLNTMEREVSSAHIGEIAMAKLKEIDDVAYVRFASVYREFKDVNSFMDELKGILEGRR